LPLYSRVTGWTGPGCANVSDREVQGSEKIDDCNRGWMGSGRPRHDGAAVHALPMRLRSEVIGALNFFDTSPGALDQGKLRIGQALADVATIGLLQQRAIHRSGVLNEQLQTALNSRVLIEQAKGILAERLHLDVADAFALLRSGARNHNRRLSDLARAIVEGTEQILPAPKPSRPS